MGYSSGFLSFFFYTYSNRHANRMPREETVVFKGNYQDIYHWSHEQKMRQYREAERYSARRSFVTFVAHIEEEAMISLWHLKK